MLNDHYTSAQLAAELGCSVETINRRVTAGHLPKPIRVGGTRLWPRSSIFNTAKQEAKK